MTNLEIATSHSSIILSSNMEEITLAQAAKEHGQVTRLACTDELRMLLTLPSISLSGKVAIEARINEIVKDSQDPVRKA